MDFDIIESLNDNEINDIFYDIIETSNKLSVFGCHCDTTNTSLWAIEGCSYNYHGSSFAWCWVDVPTLQDCSTACSNLGASFSGYSGTDYSYQRAFQGDCFSNLSNFCDVYGRSCSTDHRYCNCEGSSCR